MKHELFECLLTNKQLFSILFNFDAMILIHVLSKTASPRALQYDCVVKEVDEAIVIEYHFHVLYNSVSLSACLLYELRLWPSLYNSVA